VRVRASQEAKGPVFFLWFGRIWVATVMNGHPLNSVRGWIVNGFPGL
jgi:hypothetical protein